MYKARLQIPVDQLMIVTDSWLRSKPWKNGEGKKRNGYFASPQDCCNARTEMPPIEAAFFSWVNAASGQKPTITACRLH